MLTVLKISLIQSIEEAITVANKGYHLRNEHGERFCYSIEQKLKYFFIPKKDLPAFYKKHGLIDSYAYVNGELRMYTKKENVVSGPKGELIWEKKLVPFYFTDITFSPIQVQTFAAVHEFEIANNTIGKVFKNYLSVA